MKYKYTLLIVCVVFLFTYGCKKDVIVHPPTLVGKWYQKKLVTQLFKDIVINGDTVLKKLTSDTTTSFTKSDFTQFNNDGTGTVSSADTSSLFLKGNFNFIIISNVITFSQHAADSVTTLTESYYITRLNSNNLSLQLRDNYIGTDGIKYRKTYDKYYSRQ